MLKKIINWFKADLSKLELYKKLVTQSRQAAYYTDYKIEDSVTGRFETIVLHLFLVIHRIAKEEGNDSPNVRAMQEAFIMDMDRNLREMGVGDMSVGKQMKKMAAGWFGTAKDYEKALLLESEADRREALAGYLLENLYRDKANVPYQALADHIVYLDKFLETISLADLYGCQFDYPSIPERKDQ